ncbi:MAG TPA: TIGR03936 family radical SAM-associated protein [Acidimicrobiales bacterium]|nr:TIGR03936 family radical SAM-associated protein [Acidimicrobiales bacterium]
MRVRLRFSKLGRLRWTSHRDVARIWERALRRAQLQVAYTGGFSPRPQISFGLALPTGCESTSEYLDVAFDGEVRPEELAAQLSPVLPEGITVLAAGEVEPGAASLQQDVSACSWVIDVPAVSTIDLDRAVAATMAAATLPVRRERKGRHETDDLRPSLLALAVTDAPVGDNGGGSRLLADLATRPRGVRPSELAEALAVELGPARRTHQWIERDGSRREPLVAGADDVAPAMGRAS